MQLVRIKALVPHAHEQEPRADKHDGEKCERRKMVDRVSGVAKLNHKRNQYQHTKHVERSFHSQHGHSPKVRWLPTILRLCPWDPEARNAPADAREAPLKTRGPTERQDSGGHRFWAMLPAKHSRDLRDAAPTCHQCDALKSLNRPNPRG